MKLSAKSALCSASRSGLSTAEDSMANVAAKLAELVNLELFPVTTP